MPRRTLHGYLGGERRKAPAKKAASKTKRAAKAANEGGLTMVGKRVQVSEEVWSALNLLRQERHRSFQQLADEAFADLLQKHHRPADLKSQLKKSLETEADVKSRPSRAKA